MAARGSECHLSWPPGRIRPVSFACDLHAPPEMAISVPSGDRGCPNTFKSAASRDTDTGKGWRHAALWFPKIWDTETHGSPRSGILGTTAPRNLGTRGSTAPPNLRLPRTWNTTPSPDTPQNPDHEIPRPLPTPEPPPGAANPGAVPGAHRPLLLTGRRHLGERRSACSSLWFSRPLQWAAAEGSGSQSGPRGSSSLHFRPHVRLRRPFPWGPRWRRRVSARGGGTAGTQRDPRDPDPRHSGGVGLIAGATRERDGARDRGRGRREGSRGLRSGGCEKGRSDSGGSGGAESDSLILITSSFPLFISSLSHPHFHSFLVPMSSLSSPLFPALFAPCPVTFRPFPALFPRPSSCLPLREFSLQPSIFPAGGSLFPPSLSSQDDPGGAVPVGYVSHEDCTCSCVQ